MKKSLIFTLAFMFFPFFSRVTSTEYGCSIFCICDIWFDLKRAVCSNRRLYSIEIGISSVVEAIDFSNNSISSLSNYQLAAAGLSKLKYLNISWNGINEIDLAAFAKLNELSVLDLSKNHLNYILPDTFTTNQKLKILKLQQNNFDLHVPKLRSSSLLDLDLSSCLISHLPVDVFDNLKKLSYVNLSKNVMIQLYMKVLQRVPSLRSISLEENPWSCNRVMQETQNYFRSRKIRFSPICETVKPKKFEKMIKLEEPSEKSINSNPKTPKNSENAWEIDEIGKGCDETPKTLRTLNVSQNFNLSSAMGNTSTYLFIGIGFLLGCATTLITTYFCIYAIASCKFSRVHRVLDPSNASSQRISLLENFWSHQEEATNDSTSPICPGTPPPPYREVTLHRNLYPSAR